MAKTKAKRGGSMVRANFSGGTGNIEQAVKQVPEQVEPFLAKATKIEE